MKIGVTGTRSGLSPKQYKTVYDFLKEHTGELHHGDCIGVDVEVAQMADILGYDIICHPPLNGDKRGFYYIAKETRTPYSYFKRNRNIVDDTDILLVVPYQNEWSSNGGTWYTHDYAIKKKKRIIIFYPDGTIWKNIKEGRLF